MRMRDITIIVPVKNEASTIASLVQRIDAACKKSNTSYKIVIVDDHSSDNTPKIISGLSKKYPIKYLRKQGKLGKAYSILEGAKAATSKFVAMIDGDLQYPPEAIPTMLALTDSYDVVVANRKTYDSSPFRKFASRFNAFVFGRLLHALHFDIQSGLKLFRKNILTHIHESDLSPWAVDLPLLVTARDLGYRIGSVDIAFTRRTQGESKIHFWNAVYGIVKNSIVLKLKDPS